MNILDRAYFKVRYGIGMFVNRLREDETGVSSFVATILLIVIVVALCAVFWTQISGWFTNMWASITGQADGIGK